MGNLEGRVRKALAAQQEMIDEVEDKVDEFQTAQEEQNANFTSIIRSTTTTSKR